MAGGKAQMARRVIAAHSPHLSAKGLEIGQAVAKGAGFHGAAGRVVFRVEKKHQRLTTELVAPAFDAIGILESNQGGPITRSERGWHGGRDGNVPQL
jgi:hypothetical protein